MFKDLVTGIFTRSPLASIFLSLLLCYLIWKAFLHLQEELRKFHIYRKIPGRPYTTWFGQFFLGTMELYVSSLRHLTREKAITQLMTGFYQMDTFQNNGIGRIEIGFQRFIIVYRQDTIEKLITGMEFIEKSIQYDFLNNWLGLGLLTSTGDKWKRNRKLLTPAFHFKILDSFFPVMNENTKVMMLRFDKEIEKKGCVDVRSFIGDCTLDTICETAMGTTVGAQNEEQGIDYIGPLNQVLKLLLRRMANPLHHNDKVYKMTSDSRECNYLLDTKIHSFVRKVIRERKENMEKTLKENNVDVDTIGGQELETFTKKRYAFLDSLLLTHLKAPSEFTMKDIEDEVNTFMFEGHDTTSMSLIFTLMLVASDPRVQTKVQEELDGIYADDFERQITLEDTRQMKYLEMVIKEGLRLYPSVPFFARKLNQDVEIGGYSVPSGVTIMFVPYLVHRNKDVFPKPELFIPERFEPDAPIHKMPYAYIPFSAGPRNCIGQKFAMLEMKIILASVLRKYNVQAVTKRDEVDVNFALILKSDTPVNISFEKRQMYKTS